MKHPGIYTRIVLTFFKMTGSIGKKTSFFYLSTSFISYILDLPPTQDASGKWRFIEIPY